MKTDNVSFGTSPKIGAMSINNGLTKYQPNLTYGILDAFKKLSKNGVDDEFIINIKRNPKAKRPTTDVIELNYSIGHKFISSITLSPKGLQKLSVKRISTKIQQIYKQLTISRRNGYICGTCSVNVSKKVSLHQRKSLNELRERFEYDDYTGA